MSNQPPSFLCCGCVRSQVRRTENAFAKPTKTFIPLRSDQPRLAIASPAQQAAPVAEVYCRRDSILASRKDFKKSASWRAGSSTVEPLDTQKLRQSGVASQCR